MRPLRSKEDILEFAAARAPTNACARSIREGRAQVTPVVSQRGWIVRVFNEAGKHCWTIDVYCDEDNRKYRAEYL